VRSAKCDVRAMNDSEKEKEKEKEKECEEHLPHLPHFHISTF